MAILQGSYQPLLGGVSQQHPGAALPNQVREQLNMVTDPVLGIRRRVGAKVVQYHTPIATPPSTDKHLSQFVEVGPKKYHMFLDLHNLTMEFITEDFSQRTVLSAPSGVTVDSVASDFSIAALAGELYILNRRATPTPTISSGVPAGLDPDTTGFYWVKASAFSKPYQLSISFRLPVTGEYHTFSATYTTPNGLTVGDSDKAAPEYIVTQLLTALQADSLWPSGPFSPITSIKGGTLTFLYTASLGAAEFGMQVTTSTSDVYVQASGRMRVSAVANLPNTLGIDGVVCSVGTSLKALVYYRWDTATQTWIEAPKFGSYTGITGMPTIVTYNYTTGLPEVEESMWPLRLAGDDETNEYPAFCASPYITGIGSFQGRLVLLSGNYVSLSDSTRPTLFMRSTVNSLLDSDAIEVASGSTNSATFRQCVPYNRDLILFADGQISVVPGAAVITPKSAQVIPSSTTDVLTEARPVQSGNMILFPTPSGGSDALHSGFSSLLPSQFTSSQYSVDEATPHLPRYFPGSIKHLNASSAASFAVAQYQLDDYGLFVYQYLWSGAELKLSAWHRWEFSQRILSVHAAMGDVIVRFLTDTGLIVTTSVRIGHANLPGLTHVPYLDMWESIDWQGSPITTQFSTMAGRIAVCGTAPAIGERVGMSGTGQYILNGTWPHGTYYVGFPYTSVLSPNMPVLRDQQGSSYLMDGTHLNELLLTVRNSGEFRVESYFQGTQVWVYPASPLSWGSYELQPSQPKISEFAQVRIPFSGATSRITARFVSDGPHEFCLAGMEFNIATVKQNRRV